MGWVDGWVGMGGEVGFLRLSLSMTDRYLQQTMFLTRFLGSGGDGFYATPTFRRKGEAKVAADSSLAASSVETMFVRGERQEQQQQQQQQQQQ